MLVLILVAILWIAVLVPAVLAKFSERRSAESIGRFHKRLDLLERAGPPKIVTPAYRLTGTEGGRPVAPLVVPMKPPAVRPTLTLVRDGDDPVGVEAPETGGRMHEQESVPPHLAESAEADDRAQIGGFDQVQVGSRDRRRAARRRRRNIFGALCALTALTGLMGMAHPLRAAWVIAGLLLVLLAGFVALAVYGQHLEAERRHLDRLRRDRDGDEEGEEPSSLIRYLSEQELAVYHDALAEQYAEEDARLVAQG